MLGSGNVEYKELDKLTEMKFFKAIQLITRKENKKYYEMNMKDLKSNYDFCRGSIIKDNERIKKMIERDLYQIKKNFLK